MQINLREVKESFVATSRDILQKAESVLLEMERENDAAHFAELLRAIHTIKGNAGIFELEPLIALCHAFETRFTAVQASGVAPETAIIDLGLTTIDRMRAIIAAMDDKAKIAALDNADLIHQLENKPAAIPATGSAEGKIQGRGFDRLRDRTSKIRLPEKYFDIAKRENHYLIFLVIDLGDQEDLSTTDFFSSLATLHKSQRLLSLGVLRKDFQGDAPKGPFLPYFLILSTTERAEEIAARLKVKIVLFHYFLHPEVKPQVKTQKPSGSPHDEHVRETHLKVHLDLLNSLIDITGEIVLTRNALVRRLDTVADQGLIAFTKKLSYLVTDLQDKVMKTRLQSLDVLFHRFPRLVRETAQQTAKKAELRIEGGDIEIDKAIIDEIADPLVHIIRNAVDHGIETPAERIAVGKEEAGTVALTARAREGNIVIRVADDGRGLDAENIKNTAIRKGLISREAAAAATPQEITEYLFLPGFSTKNEVTTISGRGVGMDVVRTNIMRLGGSVEITGEQGKGSAIVIVIPQTLSILTCLLIEMGGSRFVVPQQNIVEVVTIDPSRLKNIQNKEAYELRSRLLPIVSGAEILELENSTLDAPYLVVVRTEKYHFGLKIQRVLEKEEVVVKPVPQFGQDRQIFAGAAIMGDGTIAPILDAALIGKQAGLQPNVDEKIISQETKKIAAVAVQYLLFRVHDRKVAFRIMSQPRIESIDPDKIETVVNRRVVHYRNEVIPILSLDFLGGDASAVLTNLIIVQADDRRYGILASEIMDILPDNLALRREDTDRGEIEGYAILAEETVIVLNLETLMRGALAEPALLIAGAKA
jgi:two-component system, chemotaxis family, sensor kinase CheA